MEPKDQGKLKLALAELKSRLEAQLRDDAESSDVVVLDPSRVGRLSRMDAMQAQEMALEAARRNRLELGRIEQALKRLEKSEYGYCLECGEDIDPRRLAVDPAATHCIDCANQ
jgi:DnaK suppressor protein